MHVKGKNNWIKHLDFIAINLASVVIAFVIAYYIRFGNLGFASSFVWRSALIIMCLINLVLTLALNPFSGIFRRPYYEDALKLGAFTINSFIVIGILFYVLKIGALYSRITIISTFLIYYVIVLILVCVRKKLLLSGKVAGFINRKRQLFVVSTYKNIEETEESILASDIDEYDIVGYCFTDGLYGEKEYKGRTVVDPEWLADHIVTEHIDDVFISVDPTIFPADTYKKMVENGDRTSVV